MEKKIETPIDVIVKVPTPSKIVSCVQCEMLLEALKCVHNRLVMVGSPDERHDGNGNPEFANEINLIRHALEECNAFLVYEKVTIKCADCGERDADVLAMEGARPIAVRCTGCARKIFL